MKETTVPQKVDKNLPDTREESRTITPFVDIFETGDGLMVVADMPGVEPGGVDVNVDKNVLTLKASPSLKLREELESREFMLMPYFRQFQLSDAVDQEHIRAEMKYGVLTIHLPKVAAKEPKRIAVSVS